MKPIAMFNVILLNLSHLHTDNSTKQYLRELKPRLTLQVYVADNYRIKLGEVGSEPKNTQVFYNITRL